MASRDASRETELQEQLSQALKRLELEAQQRERAEQERERAEQERERAEQRAAKAEAILETVRLPPAGALFRMG